MEIFFYGLIKGRIVCVWGFIFPKRENIGMESVHPGPLSALLKSSNVIDSLRESSPGGFRPRTSGSSGLHFPSPPSGPSGSRWATPEVIKHRRQPAWTRFSHFLSGQSVSPRDQWMCWMGDSRGWVGGWFQGAGVSTATIDQPRGWTAQWFLPLCPIPCHPNPPPLAPQATSAIYANLHAHTSFLTQTSFSLSFNFFLLSFTHAVIKFPLF